MMLIFLAVLLLSAGDIYGQSCSKRFQAECEVKDLLKTFPGNKEELAHKCRFAHKMMSCVGNVAESCEEDERFQNPKEGVAVFANKMATSIEKVCDPESQAYITISNNLECISSIAPSMHRKCRIMNLSEKRRNLTFDYAKTVKNKETFDYNKFLDDCFNVIYIMSCLTSVTSEECGEEMFQPTLQTLMELFRFNLDAACPDETIEEIPMFAFAFAMVEKEAQHASHELEQPMQAPFNSIMNPFIRR